VVLTIDDNALQNSDVQNIALNVLEQIVDTRFSIFSTFFQQLF